MIGERLGSYQLLAQIGQGGMGAVYLAEHLLMGRRVAVKVLRPEYCKSPEAIVRFFNEARATAKLQHRSFVDILDCGIHESTQRAFIIMELVQGETLAARLARRRRLPVDEAARFGYDIAVAVGIAHRAGIVHRDLKPENIFVLARHGGSEGIKILDFGIAKLSDDSSALVTRSGVLLGTPVFMSPEQCRGTGEIDARADVYALGGILFAMLCGRPPFSYQSSGELIGAHLHEVPPSPRAFEASLPDELTNLITSALAKAPNQRPRSMAQVAAVLAPLAAAGSPDPDPAPSFTSALANKAINQSTLASTASEFIATDRQTSAPRGRSRVLVAAAGALVAATIVGALVSGEKTPAPPRAEAGPTRISFPVRPPTPIETHAPAPLTGMPMSQGTVTIKVGNRRSHIPLVVTVDGQRATLPLRLPQDGGTHAVRLEMPNFKPETFSVQANRDHVLNLRYAPAALTRFD